MDTIIQSDKFVYGYNIHELKRILTEESALIYAERRIKSLHESGRYHEAGIGEPKSLEWLMVKYLNNMLGSYAEKMEMYNSWVQNGKLFLLDKRSKFICFICREYRTKFDEQNKWLITLGMGCDNSGRLTNEVKCIPHYNPLEKDYITETKNPNHTNEFDYLNSDYWDILRMLCREKEYNPYNPAFTSSHNYMPPVFVYFRIEPEDEIWIENDRYVISKDEQKLIKICDKLISENH